MRYIGLDFEKESRQQRLAHYRKQPGFEHLKAPGEAQTADPNKQADPEKQVDPEKEEEGLAHYREDCDLDDCEDDLCVLVSKVDENGYVEFRVIGPIERWYGFLPDRIIRALDKPEVKHIHTVISSPGGYIELTQAVYSFLRRQAKKGVKVTSEGLALVASAGLDLFLAGDERTASDDTLFMQHPIHGWTCLGGSKPEITQQYNELMSHMDAFIGLNYRIFRERTGQSDEVLEQWLLQPGEIWFSVDQAYENGLLTEEPESTESSIEAAMQQKARRMLQHAA